MRKEEQRKLCGEQTEVEALIDNTIKIVSNTKERGKLLRMYKLVQYVYLSSK